MKIYLDASAIVAMIAREPEAAIFAQHLDAHENRITSPTALWEAVRGVQSARGLDFDEARDLVDDFVSTVGIEIVPIGAIEGREAIEAHRRFGKGVHPAALNFGDCFGYACTKLHAEVILFKGDDFAETDLKDALLA